MGFVFHDRDLVVLHDPIAKKVHRLGFNDYDNFNGDMEGWINHILEESKER